MNIQEKLQYSENNYSDGDIISREGFNCNSNQTTIIMDSKGYHMFGDSVYCGRSQVYCNINKVWAVNLSNPITKSKISYEIY